jgi:hypothetical protein
MSRLIICIDWDGCIHDYMDGWRDGSIYGDVVPGFIEWADIAREHFELVVYSSRSKTEAGIAAMRERLHAWIEAAYAKNTGLAVSISDFTFASEKPPAWLTIDDRALCFNGNWSDPNFSVEAMRSFKPWNKPL